MSSSAIVNMNSNDIGSMVSYKKPALTMSYIKSNAPTGPILYRLNLPQNIKIAIWDVNLNSTRLNLIHYLENISELERILIGIEPEEDK